ncbi:MAG: LamG-like jellyroll fold domain-containing protein, partial [Sedimentisphaerales bacterium]
SSSGIYVNAYQDGLAWERPTSVELLNPDGSEGFHINAGVRIRGAFSRDGGNPKHALRLFFRSVYGAGKLQYPLFGSEGVDEFDKIDLRTSQNNSWAFEGSSQNTLIRDVFSRDVQRDMGQPYTRSRYYHLYINGHYWGLYQTQERADADFAESYLGGDKEEYDVVKNDSSASRVLHATDGTMDAYQRLYNAAVAGFTSDSAYLAVQGLQPDGTPDPGGERLLDPENVMDYMICTYYTGDPDAPVSCWAHFSNNVFAIYNRVRPQGFTWYRHDAEHSLGANGGVTEGRLLTDPTDRTIGQYWQHFNPAWLHLRLTDNPEYLMQFADRVNKYFLNGGLLAAAPNIQRWMTRAGQIDLAIIAESARWGDSKTYPPLNKTHWEGQNNYMVNTFFPQRTQIVINQMRSVNMFPYLDAPVFNINGSYQHGGEVSAGDVLTMDNPPSGTIYYTIDGSDPRQPVSGNAIGTIYTNSVTLNKTTHVKARVRDGSTWSALNEAIFAIGPLVESLRITEIMYHPRNAGALTDPNEEFIELKNIGTSTLNLNLVQFTEGIHFTFPDMELDPNECVVVVEDQGAFEAKYGTSVNMAGQYTGSLANDGERIKLQDAIGQPILDFEYKDGWHSIADGDGFSLTMIDPTDKAPYSWDEGLVAHWKFDDGTGGTAIDSAGTNNGTLYGDKTWTTGRIDGALSFDGDGDYVAVGPIPPLAEDSLTAQAWICVDEFAEAYIPVLMQRDSGYDGYYFYVINSAPTFYVINGLTSAQVISPETINADQWYHVAATNDGSNLKLYVDGQLKDSLPSTGFTGVSNNVYIGCEPLSPLYYAGLIDDVRIYERPVSESEFQNIADPMGRWSQKSSWRACVYRNGSPGWDDSSILPNPGAVVINEVMSHSNAGPDWIELHNT